MRAAADANGDDALIPYVTINGNVCLSGAAAVRQSGAGAETLERKVT